MLDNIQTPVTTTDMSSLIAMNLGGFKDFSFDKILPVSDIQNFFFPAEAETITEVQDVQESNWTVGGYWEPWHKPTNPGSGTDHDESYYENDFKNLDRVFYAFLTLDETPDPDAPHEKYWDGQCFTDVETAACVDGDLEWPPAYPNPVAWNAFKIEAMYK